MRLSLAAGVLLWSIHGLAQVSVVEPATRAVLVDGHTTISLAVENRAPKALDVRIRLQWLDPEGKVERETLHSASLPPGASAVSIAHPLPAECDPLVERLDYDVYADARNYTAFAPTEGVLSFPNIADYAFTFGVLTAGIPRAGQPFEVRVLTEHPITGRPVEGVTVKAEKATAVTGPDGVAVLRVVRDADDDDSIDVTAQIGDVAIDGESTGLRNWPDAVHGYTDKPIYQPGQTMHVRILAVGGSGRVKAGAEYEIRVADKEDDLVYSAKVKTSRFGVASTDWEIPENAAAGQYKVELKTSESSHYVLRAVNIRRYELPSFRVTAAPDHPFYLAGQKAQVEIRGEYLFGKPVTAGKARITTAGDDDNDENAAGSDKESVAEGALDAEGLFRATLDTKADFDENTKFEDRHFIAFLTDESTNRTEQRKFDLRISRDPVHIYAVRMENDGAGRRLYITTYSPDGTPVRSDVEVANQAGVLGKGKTNRFGLARIELPAPNANDDEKLEVRAATAEGLHARMELTFDKPKSGLWLRTDRTLYRAGEAVKCAVGSTGPERQVLLVASNGDQQVVFTKSLWLKNGQAEVEIPYDKRFGRVLSVGVVAGAGSDVPSRQVCFPGPSDLVVKAVPTQATYRPGETASVRFKASAEAALGIAVVDQSVLERAATDSAFGRRSWFEGNSGQEQSLGGITGSDLTNLAPAKIDDDLQLVAEVLSAEGVSIVNNADDAAEKVRQAFEAAGPKQLAPVLQALDQQYLRTLEYPRDDASFQRITLSHGLMGRRDPWLRPFKIRFSIEGADAVLSFVSAGPDKKLGTADDYTAATVRRKWFAEYESLMRQGLSRLKDYPAAPEEFVRLLDAAGIRFEALRDPWSGPLRVDVGHWRQSRVITILSAGPDRKFGTADDAVVAEFRGTYFSAIEAKIDQILKAAPEFPSTEAEFRALLAKSGVDFDSLRDPWGRGYYLAFHDDASFTDQVQVYTYAEYNGAPEERKQVTPVKQTRRTIEIRSVGDDGRKGTYDDFAVAMFSRVLRKPQAPEQPKIDEKTAQAATTLGGNGTITGAVKDQTGAVVPEADVQLNDLYDTRTDGEGKFVFRDLPAGEYRLSCFAAGFQRSVIEGIPAEDGHVTRTELVLVVGTVAASVEVQAEVLAMQTDSAQMSVALSAASVPHTALSTPRVREYFPETLYWQPELITDPAGRATVGVKLADSVTTWHVAVIGSTVDGRIAEGSADIRAFQPFLVDLDVPPVLTVGDEISLPVPVRNYTERPQRVAVTAKLGPELRLLEAVRQPGAVAPSSSANALLTLRAEAAAKSAPVRVTAVGGSASDAIEKTAAIHPDGEPRAMAINSVVASGQALPLAVAANAIAGSIRGEVKIYPSLLARILESIEALLKTPHGCAEQVISSSYPNLLLLQALQKAGLTDEPLTARATKNLMAGYQRLVGYQDSGGGFTYWGRGDADVALTAYALAFLADAKAFLPVDEDRVKDAREWLAKQKTEDPAANALRMRALARWRVKDSTDLDRQLGEMARKAAEFGDPYAMAAYALAALDADHAELAGPVIEQLGRLAQDERGAAYWALRANTPYHGWGRAGQVETTALVVSALAHWRKAGHDDAALKTLIDRGALFLLQNAEGRGGWSTSQATVRALVALLDTWDRDDDARAAQVEVRVNGASAGTVALPAGRSVRGPLVVDISRQLRAGANEVSLTGFAPRAQQVQMTAVWYEPWGPKRLAKELDMQVRYGTLAAAINQPVACDVEISRPSFRGYGMMIAEIGLPPGAEVDRGVLEDIVGDARSGVDSYEVAPDHAKFYVWPRAADVKFRFLFRPRFAMKARAAQSALYDYYNPDERVVLAPASFVVGR
jgi:hypothetical protein